MDDGDFREDLYYRLSVITIFVPPLRDRREDVGELARHFMKVYSEENGVPLRDLTSAALGLLIEHDWPGNVRELSNAVERLMVLGEGNVIDAGQVRDAIRARTPDAESHTFANLRDAREQFEREFIKTSLLAHEWRIQETAVALGINRSHLWKKMKQLGISTEPAP